MGRTGKVRVLDIAIFCMVAKIFMESSAAIPSIKFLDNMVVLLYIICVVTLTIKNRYSAKSLLLIGAISVALLYTSLITGYSDPLITFLFIVAMKGRDIDSIFQKIYKFYCIMFALHMILAIVIGCTGRIRMVMNIRGIDRYTLGFIHPNTAAAKFFVLMMLRLWIKKNVKGQLVSCIAVSTIVYVLCRSRTAYMLSLATIFMVYAMRKQNAIVIKIIHRTSGIIFPVMALFMLIVIKLYEVRNPVALFVNEALSGRVNLAAYAMSRVGFTILGRRIDFYGELSTYSAKYALNYFTFDCVYSFIFCSMGLIYLVILSFLFYKLASKKILWVNASIIIWSLYAVTEVSCLNGFNLFPIFYLALLADNRAFGEHKFI